MSFGAQKRAFLGGRFCGDQWAVWEEDDRALACLIDGLGHGEDAEVAAKAALAYVGDNLAESLSDIIVGCDAEIRGTRGVAIGLARVDRTSQDFRYAAVGNTRAAIIGMDEQYLVGISGIVGAGIRKPFEETFRFDRHQTLAMWSDGLAETINFSPYRSMLRGDLQQLAEEILAENAVEDDDASLVLYRKI